ncbi:malate permease [Stenotrophomonas pictorum JCM 9942]|jgi:predicted permease|uniref:Malate permease n=1 Tax=Stenotrophomonas pictorum JCM 9942 TaxID=1236960 RepID=A0A0R0ADT3_9GAMM|nr:AEC family transporter [Stenotrophomonas pictorum]KRG42895.1 malate permease [Stenotrophomonas pictorum JCM 9942]
MAFDAFALILAMLALGMVFARLRTFPDNAADTLNKVVLYVCLPAAVLTYVPRLQLDTALLGLMLTPWVLMGLTLALVSLATRLFGFERQVHAVLLLCVALCNSSFIGYPMVRALLGDHALPYAVVYDQFGTFVLLSTFGLYVLARYSGDAPPGGRAIVLRILKFPPLWALGFALVLMPASPPAWIALALKNLADAMLPLVMLAVGLTIQLRLTRAELAPLGVGLLLKLVVLPAAALPLSWAFGLQGEMLRVNVLETAMPTMITAAALAISHRLAPRLAAALVGYGIVLSLVTLPVWVWVLHRVS